MPLLLPTKTTATVVIAGVFSVLAAVIFTFPSVSHFVVSFFPIIYDNTIFLFKPPYLYLVINCIIVSIVSTSKLMHKSSSNDDSEISEVVTLVPVQVPSDIDTGYLNVVHVASDYTGFVKKNDVQVVAPFDLTVEDDRKFPEVITDDKLKLDNGEDHQQTEKPKPSSDSPEKPILKHTRKPPRFNQQKPLRSNPEGRNKKSALGVSKPPRRQNETLEMTWKKITEERSTPLTKLLTKSDTWQERAQVQSSSEKQKEKMTKSENLNDINAPTTQKTRLKRESSPGQEELNRRVEAFINKFNEEMRLQRLESLAKYNEMISGGTRL